MYYYGTADNDTLKGNKTSFNVIYGYAGADHLTGGNYGDILYGGIGVDTLVGGSGDDVLYGDTGNVNTGAFANHVAEADKLSGGSGNDYIEVSYGGSADGGDGTDTVIVDLSGAATGVRLDLGALANGGSITLGGGVIKNFEAWHGIIGSAHDDYLAAGDIAQGYWSGLGFLNQTVVIDAGAGNDVVHGSVSADQIKGGAGDDVLHGADGDDHIIGDAGSDNLFGDDGNDLLEGGAGTNSLHGGDGNDVLKANFGDAIDGGSGTDILYLTAVGNDPLDLNFVTGHFSSGGSIARVEEIGQWKLGGGDDTVVLGNQSYSGSGVQAGVFGNDGDDHLTGGTKGDHLFGGNGDDVLAGLAGNDVIDAGGGADDVAGGDGNDVLIGGSGDDRIDGGAGFDIASFSTSSSGVHVVLGKTGAQNTIGAGHDTLVNIEAVLGSGHDDTLSGGGKDDVFYTTAGHDTIGGASGSDTLSFAMDSNPYGRSIAIDLSLTGSQDVIGGTLKLSSIENLIGGSESDSFTGNGAANRLDAGASNDVLYGNAGDDTLIGGSGDDFLDGGAGRDHIDGGTGNDTIQATAASDLTGDILVGGSGTDRLMLNVDDGGNVDLTNALSKGDIEELDAVNGVVSLTRSELDKLTLAYASQIYLTSGGTIDLTGTTISTHNLHLAKSGNVVDLGRAESETVDTVSGDSGKDAVTAEHDALVAFGWGGDDVLTGGTRSDTLDGGTGKDEIDGGVGNDRLTGGAGADEIDGGSGNDVIVIDKSGDAAGDVIHGGKGTDTLSLSDAHPGVLNLDDQLAAADVEKIAAAGWTISLSGSELDYLTALSAKTLYLHTGGSISFKNVTIDLSTFHISDNATTVDFSHAIVENPIKIVGGAAGDHITGTSNNDIIDGGGGADVMAGGGGGDTFVVDNANDVISSGSIGNVLSSVDYTLTGSLYGLTLTGSARHGTGNSLNNTITGTSGNDMLSGGGGDDMLTGGKGDDVLYGGTGTERFDGGDGNDIVHADDKYEYINGGNGHDIAYIASGDSFYISSVEEIHLTGGLSYFGAEYATTIYANTSRASTITGSYDHDVLIGGNGADTLNGSAGSDVLQGGGGGDRFVFSEFSTTDVDEIKDYSSAKGDVLDFTPLEDTAINAGVTQINYLGTGAFTGHGGEARIDLHSGYGLFQFDLDGDRVSDLTIRLDGVTATSAIKYEI